MAEMTGTVLVHKLEVALCIVPQHPGVTDEEISINPDLGFFRVPVQTSPAQIYRYIQVHRQNVSLGFFTPLGISRIIKAWRLRYGKNILQRRRCWRH